MKPIHGKCETRLYRIWCGIKQRCLNSNDKRFLSYGKRGIKLCIEWYDYINFEKWALANAYSDELQIDRIDNNGDYEQNNCRWVTSLAQQNNRRNNVIITMFGKTLTIRDWARLLGVDASTFKQRYYNGEIGSYLIRPVTKRFKKDIFGLRFTSGIGKSELYLYELRKKWPESIIEISHPLKDKKIGKQSKEHIQKRMEAIKRSRLNKKINVVD